MNYSTEFKCVKDEVHPEEWQARVNLTADYGLIDNYEMTDLIYDHVTVRISGTEHLLINLYGLLYKQITTSHWPGSTWRATSCGSPTGYGTNQAGCVIYGAIHNAMPDVVCVTHTDTGVAVSSMACGLLPLNQTSIRFHGNIGCHDYEVPAINTDERERIVHSLGEHNALIMRSCGLLSCGPDIPQAFNTLYQLEMSSRAQVDAMAARTELLMPPAEILDRTVHLSRPGTRLPYDVLEWPAMIRRPEADSHGSGFIHYAS